ncbi:MAG: GntR family transcriptional regulator, partial [Tateyamaria sp.]
MAIKREGFGLVLRAIRRRWEGRDGTGFVGKDGKGGHGHSEPDHRAQDQRGLVFDALYDEIVDLSLLPGTKMSEVDVAKRFDLSRQPVREAFRRLSEQGLLAIRPQRPTIVRHFSLTEIRNARFIRAGVELEVLKKACVDRDVALDAPLDACMADQEAALAANDVDAFHAHDYQFHKLLCEAAGAGFAFKVIADSKALVDRLCM